MLNQYRNLHIYMYIYYKIYIMNHEKQIKFEDKKRELRIFLKPRQ